MHQGNAVVLKIVSDDNLVGQFIKTLFVKSFKGHLEEMGFK